MERNSFSPAHVVGSLQLENHENMKFALSAIGRMILCNLTIKSTKEGQMEKALMNTKKSGGQKFNRWGARFRTRKSDGFMMSVYFVQKMLDVYSAGKEKISA